MLKTSWDATASHLKRLIDEAEQALPLCHDAESLKQLRARHLGKKSWFFEQIRALQNESLAIKQQWIPVFQQVRGQLQEAFERHTVLIERASWHELLQRHPFDATLPASTHAFQGNLHPISQTLSTLVSFFQKAGFQVGSGPEIEMGAYNFDHLNFPPSHPALKRKESFWLNDDHLLRTHTSNVQLRMMMSGKPPFRCIAPGRVYRPDSDATHTPMFHQVEGFVVDRGIHFGHLKWTLSTFLGFFFKGLDPEIRFRASYFPFTSPSVEVDIRLKGESRWLEVLGCGMIHPNVLRNCKVDPEIFQGFAFGMGVERLTMIRHQLGDLRALFDHDIRFLAAFSSYREL